MTSSPPPPSSSAFAALLACGRRGRWRTALELLEQLEAEFSQVDGPDRRSELLLPAYHSVLLACRKHERQKEAADVLARMGAAADTAAYNEVLHLLRLKSDFDGAIQLWEAMAPGARDRLGYYHLLDICGQQGRWQFALALLDEMRAQLGDDAPSGGHYLAALRACAKDRRWSEAVALARSLPAESLAQDKWLA